MTVNSDGDAVSRIASLGRRLQGASVRTKILGMILTLTVVLGIAVGLQVRMTTRDVVEGELDRRGEAVAEDLAARVSEPLLLGDRLMMFDLVSSAIENHDDVVYAFVVDATGDVLAHTFGAGEFPIALLELPRSEDAYVFDSDLGRTRDFREDVPQGQGGFVALGLGQSRVDALVAGVSIQMLLTTLAVAVIGIGGAVLLTRILVRPIHDLVVVAERVGGGDLTARVNPLADDEIGVLADTFNQMAQDLDASRATIAEKEEARARLLDELIEAQEEERRRIARELHDGIGQSLNSLAFSLATLSTSNGELADRVEPLRVSTLETLDSVRRMSRELRPSVLDDLGLTDAVKLYLDEIAVHYPGLELDAHLDLDVRPAASVETAVYRMIQEGVTNAARHSGGSSVSVVATSRAGRLRVLIEDDGAGFDVDSALQSGRGVGLHAIRERAEIVSGSAHIESGGSGTSVIIEVPA